jgi:hypothetical protein
VSCEKVFVVKTNPLESGVAMRRIEACTCVAAIATRMASAMATGHWSRVIVRREAHGSAWWPTSGGAAGGAIAGQELSSSGSV